VQALAATAAAAMVLVLPAGLDPAEAADQARAFAALGARLLVATRLDMARRLGGILAAAEAGLALTEAGIGPGAADGLLPITPAWLAARLMTGPHT
jgi:flagellar biosynthesis protein FlhF